MSVDVAFYLSHLLYRNNVAILPGFGAFITTPTHSVIDHARGTFTPPSKLLTFNENLKINDGFLINLIRQKHGYSAHEARAIVENFVQSINDILNNKDTVRLDKIGKLYFNINKQIVFEPEPKTNFNAASFGLPAVQYYPLPKQKAEELPTQKEEVKPVVETPQPTESFNIPQSEPILREIKPSWLEQNRFAAAAILFGLFATTAIWYFNNNRNKGESQANLSVPVSEIRVNVKPGMEEENSTELNSQAVDNQENTTTNRPLEEPNAALQNESVQKQADKNKSKQRNEFSGAPIVPENLDGINSTIFIVGTYSKPANIRRATKIIKQKGFELYNVSFNGMRRVGAVLRFNSEIEKNNQIERLRSEFGGGIWELEK